MFSVCGGLVLFCWFVVGSCICSVECVLNVVVIMKKMIRIRIILISGIRLICGLFWVWLLWMCIC